MTLVNLKIVYGSKVTIPPQDANLHPAHVAECITFFLSTHVASVLDTRSVTCRVDVVDMNVYICVDVTLIVSYILRIREDAVCL